MLLIMPSTSIKTKYVKYVWISCAVNAYLAFKVLSQYISVSPLVQPQSQPLSPSTSILAAVAFELPGPAF